MSSTIPPSSPPPPKYNEKFTDNMGKLVEGGKISAGSEEATVEFSKGRVIKDEDNEIGISFHVKITKDGKERNLVILTGDKAAVAYLKGDGTNEDSAKAWLSTLTTLLMSDPPHIAIFNPEDNSITLQRFDYRDGGNYLTSKTYIISPQGESILKNILKGWNPDSSIQEHETYKDLEDQISTQKAEVKTLEEELQEASPESIKDTFIQGTRRLFKGGDSIDEIKKKLNPANSRLMELERRLANLPKDLKLAKTALKICELGKELNVHQEDRSTIPVTLENVKGGATNFKPDDLVDSPKAFIELSTTQMRKINWQNNLSLDKIQLKLILKEFTGGKEAKNATPAEKKQIKEKMSAFLSQLEPDQLKDIPFETLSKEELNLLFDNLDYSIMARSEHLNTLAHIKGFFPRTVPIEIDLKKVLQDPDLDEDVDNADISVVPIDPPDNDEVAKRIVDFFTTTEKSKNIFRKLVSRLPTPRPSIPPLKLHNVESEMKEAILNQNPPESLKKALGPDLEARMTSREADDISLLDSEMSFEDLHSLTNPSVKLSDIEPDDFKNQPAEVLLEPITDPELFQLLDRDRKDALYNEMTRISPELLTQALQQAFDKNPEHALEIIDFDNVSFTKETITKLNLKPNFEIGSLRDIAKPLSSKMSFDGIDSGAWDDALAKLNLRGFNQEMIKNLLIGSEGKEPPIPSSKHHLFIHTIDLDHIIIDGLFDTIISKISENDLEKVKNNPKLMEKLNPEQRDRINKNIEPLANQRADSSPPSTSTSVSAAPPGTLEPRRSDLPPGTSVSGRSRPIAEEGEDDL